MDRGLKLFTIEKKDGAWYDYDETKTIEGGEADMAEQQVKSRARVTAHGEVFTAQREVNAMLDLVKQETERIDSRFLESKTRYLIQFNDSPLRGVA